MEHVYEFSTKEKKYELFFADFGHVEVYEANNPKEGFIFSNEKNLNSFINSITSIVEKRQMENKENG